MILQTALLVAYGFRLSGFLLIRELKNASYKKVLKEEIKDLNCNGKWDPGNYWNNRQSEPVYFLPKTIELRNNWEIEEIFSLAE